MQGMTADLVLMLGEKGVKTLDDLGDLATDELLEMLPQGLLNEKQAQRLIMAARQHWFTDPDAEESAEEEVDAAEAKAAEQRSKANAAKIKKAAQANA
jgi:N utilization substance protein A